VIPLELWQPSGRDLAGFYAVPFFRRITQTLAAIIVQNDFVVPFDAILVLNGYHLESFAGGAQLTSDLQVLVLPQVQITGVVLIGSAPGTTRAFLTSRHDNLWIPPASIVRGEALFNSPTLGNTFTMSVFGYLIPRGNIAQA